MTIDKANKELNKLYNDLNYYVFTQSIIRNTHELEIFLKKHVKNKKIVFRFDSAFVANKSKKQIISSVNHILNKVRLFYGLFDKRVYLYDDLHAICKIFIA